MTQSPLYTLWIVIDGINGIFRCRVHDAEQRVKAIREQGYFRKAECGFSEWYPPHKIRFISIEGPAPEAAIEDEWIPSI